MGITELAETVRAGLERLEQLARDADRGEPWSVTTDWTGPSVWLNDTLEGVWARDGMGVSAAYTCDDPNDDCRDARASYEAEAQLIVQLADPARVLRDVAARRQLLDQALAWEHGHAFNGEGCPGDPCLCGRDERVLAVLQALAAPYQETT